MGNELFSISDEYRTFFGSFLKVTGTHFNSCSGEKVWTACFLSLCSRFLCLFLRRISAKGNNRVENYEDVKT